MQVRCLLIQLLEVPFGDSLSELDWEVGQIIDTLESEGVSENTFVFFSSDNGPSLMKGPSWRQTLACSDVVKGNYMGRRTERNQPIAWWPGKVQPGRSAELSATVDLLPTICSITGAKKPSVTLDGMDMSGILFEGKASERDYYIHYPEDPNPKYGIFAVRWKQYKAHFYQHGSHCLNTFPDVVCRNNFTMRKD